MAQKRENLLHMNENRENHGFNIFPQNLKNNVGSSSSRKIKPVLGDVKNFIPTPASGGGNSINKKSSFTKKSKPLGEQMINKENTSAAYQSTSTCQTKKPKNTKKSHRCCSSHKYIEMDFNPFALTPEDLMRLTTFPLNDLDVIPKPPPKLQLPITDKLTDFRINDELTFNIDDLLQNGSREELNEKLPLPDFDELPDFD